MSSEKKVQVCDATGVDDRAYAGYKNLILIPANSWFFPQRRSKDDIIKEHPNVEKEEEWPEVRFV